MRKPILVGYDSRDDDRGPVEFGAAAAQFTGAPLIVAGVHAGTAGLGGAGHGVVEDNLSDESGLTLDHVGRDLAGRGIDAEVRALPGTSAPRALHHAAEEFGAGLLVIGSTRRGHAGRVVPGSTAGRLMHGAPCALAVVPHGWQPGGGLETIGVAFVDTDEGRKALAGAAALARRAGARLRVLSAAKPHGFSETFGGGDPLTHATSYEGIAAGVRGEVERAVQQATASLSDLDIDPDVSVGDPADFLITASERLDLLICGSRGYGPARAVLLGGVSRRVTTEAHCPVIVLARGTDAGLEGLVDEAAGAVG